MKREEPAQNTSEQAANATDDQQLNRLIDLPVAAEQAEQIKGEAVVGLYHYRRQAVDESGG